jgi:hypothetical protein
MQAHSDADPKAAAASQRRAAALLASVPVAARADAWHQARRQLRKTQIETAVLQQEIDRIAHLARLLETEIGEWPPAMQRSPDAALDRALASHYRGYHGYFTDALDAALTALRDAEQQLVALERARPNDPVILFTLMWNGYVGYGAASGLPQEAAEARRFLAVARDTSDRLLRIEPADNALKSFAANVRQMEAQALASEGRSRQALALQQEVVALFEAALTRARRPATLNRLAVAQLTLGNIAATAGDAVLACRGYRASHASIAELGRRGELLGFVESYRAGVESNTRRCDRGEPLGQLAILG